MTLVSTRRHLRTGATFLLGMMVMMTPGMMWLWVSGAGCWGSWRVAGGAGPLDRPAPPHAPPPPPPVSSRGAERRSMETGQRTAHQYPDASANGASRCAGWNCSCQNASDTYGIDHHRKAWGTFHFAAAPPSTPPRLHYESNMNACAVFCLARTRVRDVHARAAKFSCVQTICASSHIIL